MNLCTVLLIAAIIVIIGLLYLKFFPRKETHGTPHAGSYIGKVFTLEFPVINGTGILQVDNTTWRIHSPDLPAGSRIKITGVDGMVLLAEPNRG